MKKLVVLILFINVISSYSQEKLRAIKVFSGYEYRKINNISNGQGDFNSSANFDLLKSISFAFGTTKYFHEFELYGVESDYTQNKTMSNGNVVNGDEYYTTNIRLRYSFNSSIRTSQRLNLIIGASFSPYFNKEKIKPLVGSRFDNSTKHYGFLIELISRVQYNLRDNLFLELTLPCTVFNWYFERVRIDNPAIPPRQQINDAYNSDLMPSIIQASLGFGYKF